ncbi:MAG: DUF1043 family protein [Succinatimonas sp.]|nr:DUF1043 family protein [Succinatimonas sp.]
MSYMLVVLAFIIGFFAGTLCYSFGLVKIFSNHRMQDELTRTKRELASAKRVLDEFFKTSGQLFGQLDKSYRAYAKFMNEAAGKLSSSDGSLFIPQDELEVEDSLKKMLRQKHSETSETGSVTHVNKGIVKEEVKNGEHELSAVSNDEGALKDAKETISVKNNDEKF